MLRHSDRARHFNPRSPRGERLVILRRRRGVHRISIHAPRVGSDAFLPSSDSSFQYFNPRSPRGERRFTAIGSSTDSYFNPRSPRGERHVFVTHTPVPSLFQSTLPAWGATYYFSTCYPPYHNFNPRGDDARRVERINFNPRSPRGERRPYTSRRCLRGNISIHAPRVGSDSTFNGEAISNSISIHAPRVGSDVISPPIRL